MPSPDYHKTHPALDISKYSLASPPAVLTADLASLAVEARTSSAPVDVNRIWWYDSLPEQLNTSASEFPHSLAALEIDRLLKSLPPGQARLILLVSPAYRFSEARLDLIFATSPTSFDVYGIPVRESPRLTEARLNQFALRSDTPDLPPLTGLDAVTTPLWITLPSAGDLLPTARTWIDLPESVWQQIASGEIKTRCQELTAACEPIAQAILSDIGQQLDPHQIGLIAESRMADVSGWDIDISGSDCGLPNSAFLNSASADSAAGSKTESARCPEIICPRCDWKPQTKQVAQITSGHLKTCPCCNWPEAPLPAAVPEPALPNTSLPTFVPTINILAWWSWLSDWQTKLSA
jgi:hypothetical protein